jgi:hypothetical protein
MTDPDEILRAAAVKSIRHYSRLKNHPFLDFNFKRRMEHIMVHDDSPLVRGEAARYLMTSCPPEEMPPLIQDMLAHEDPVVRCKVIETAAELGMQFADFPIESTLEDKDPLVRASAVLALWPIHDRKDETTNALRKLMEGKTSDEQIAGFRTAVKLQTDAFLLQAEQALTNSQLEIRIFGALVFLLADREDHPMWKPALEILVSAISDPDHPKEIRKEIVALSPNLCEQGLDAVMIGLTMLPETQRKNAANAMKDFYSVYYRTISNV